MKQKLIKRVFKVMLYTGIGCGTTFLQSCDNEAGKTNAHTAEFFGGQRIADRRTNTFMPNNLMRHAKYKMNYLDVCEKSIAEYFESFKEHGYSDQSSLKWVTLTFDCSTTDTVLLKQMYPNYSGQMTAREFNSSSQRLYRIKFRSRDNFHDVPITIAPKDVIFWYVSDRHGK